MRIPVEHGHLEANLRQPEGDPRGAAVFCHPHPRHGGNMHTKAVFRAAQAMTEAGLLVLRFNFRGVGTSTGEYDEGRGEREDLRAALDFLSVREPDLPLVAGGFSFGSMVALRAAMHDPRVAALVGIGLPFELYEFDFLQDLDRPLLVVQGENDEFGGGERAEAVLRERTPHATVVQIAGSDHFFHDRFEELKEAVREFFLHGDGARALLEAPGAGRAGPGARGNEGGVGSGTEGSEPGPEGNGAGGTGE